MAYDKRLHFWCGLSICLLIGIATTPHMGLTVAIAAGISKEIYDVATGRGTPEQMDFVATAIGGFLGTLLLALLR